MCIKEDETIEDFERRMKIRRIFSVFLFIGFIILFIHCIIVITTTPKCSQVTGCSECYRTTFCYKCGDSMECSYDNVYTTKRNGSKILLGVVGTALLIIIISLNVRRCFKRNVKVVPAFKPITKRYYIIEEVVS